MRPVNLIPPEDRRGDRAPLRAGSLSYVVVGAFAAALVVVLMLVLTQNSITDHENEIAQLEVARESATQRAEALAPYAEFASLQAQREQTIASLAESRFDWERVLRELALVIPGGVSLDSLEAEGGGGAAAEGASEAGSGIGGAPSLLMAGCAPSQDGVAEFVAALEDIDGVTRVGLESSESGSDAGSSGGGSGQETGAPAGDCGASGAAFSLTAVFDGAVAQPATEAAASGAAPTSTPAETNSTPEQVQESKQAANLVPGVAP